jgi:hypothetical protein
MPRNVVMRFRFVKSNINKVKVHLPHSVQ